MNTPMNNEPSWPNESRRLHNMNDTAKLIIISDLLDTKARKEKELAFYNEQLKELQGKMFWVQKEIDLTTDIIDMIEREKMMDIQKWMKERKE
jgi:hypothetical protein